MIYPEDLIAQVQWGNSVLLGWGNRIAACGISVMWAIMEGPLMRLILKVVPSGEVALAAITAQKEIKNISYALKKKKLEFRLAV